MSFAPTTPSHALPGAFLHTPAIASRLNTQQQNDPTRRRLFTDQPTTAAANGPAAPQPPHAHPHPHPPNTTYARDPSQPFGFDAPTVDNRQTMPPPTNPIVNPQTPLAKAATYINASLTEDESYPDLDSYCRRQCLCSLCSFPFFHLFYW